MFCERGIRTFETYTRNTLDSSAIPIIKNESHCPIVHDPGQGAGRADLVAALCNGLVAMGADVLLTEGHPNPVKAWSDGTQQVSIGDFSQSMCELQPWIAAVRARITRLACPTPLSRNRVSDMFGPGRTVYALCQFTNMPARNAG